MRTMVKGIVLKMCIESLFSTELGVKEYMNMKYMVANRMPEFIPIIYNITKDRMNFVPKLMTRQWKLASMAWHKNTTLEVKIDGLAFELSYFK